jgi:hypothetical protein
MTIERWVVYELILFFIFIAGAVSCCWKGKSRKWGMRLMAVTALCAFVFALDFMTSSEMPDLTIPISKALDSLVSNLPGG